jgi:ATP-dependent DNA helicase RecG
VFDFIKLKVAQGRQVYIVYPHVEETAGGEVKAVMKELGNVQRRLAPFVVGVVHGALSSREKEDTMEAFRLNHVQALLATPLIEVGVDVPNASVMLIENAERFGLAQLHQLRGRVGRGEEQSYCILITEGGSDVARERAEIMKSTNDGFLIAEKDLELRGPGEFFGMRQHGVPELKLADLVRHIKILNTVREESERLLSEDERLEGKDYVKLKRKIDKMFKNTESLNI